MEAQRELELYIGPLQEWKGTAVNSQSLQIISNGDVGTLKVQARIQKNCVSAPNLSTISIWNLDRNTINSLRRAGGVSVNLYAGFQGEAKELVYAGGIQAIQVSRQGPDIVTTLICLTGGANLARATTSKTYTYKVPVADVVRELAETIPGVVADPTNINVTGTIGYAGWSFIGSTKEALDKLAYQFGFSWSIQDGKFVAISDGRTTGQGILLNAANGLKKVSPRLTGLMQYQEGVDIEGLYVPNVGPNKLIKIKSEVNPECNGNWTCHTIDYDLCPKDNSWDMHITSFLTFGAWDNG